MLHAAIGVKCFVEIERLSSIQTIDRQTSPLVVSSSQWELPREDIITRGRSTTIVYTGSDERTHGDSIVHKLLHQLPSTSLMVPGMFSSGIPTPDINV